MLEWNDDWLMFTDQENFLEHISVSEDQPAVSDVDCGRMFPGVIYANNCFQRISPYWHLK